MSTDNTILRELINIRAQGNDNHVEVVQRLTALETACIGLPTRVAKLEKYQNRAAGALAVLSIASAHMSTWVLRHLGLTT